ncbi:hypothetical protein KJ940_03365, partial [Myxococcota bacterium]|nr:hypothetical protein [Myxococcota bacterium]
TSPTAPALTSPAEAPREQQRPRSPRELREGGGPRGEPRGEPRPAPPQDRPLVASFAELLEAHLPANASMGEVASPQRNALVTLKAPPRREGASAPQPIPLNSAPTPQPSPSPTPLPPEESLTALRLKIVRQDKAAEVALNEQAQLRQALAEARAEAKAAQDELLSLKLVRAEVARLKVEAEQLRMERTTLRQQQRALDDERGTLASTCAELQEELAEAREALKQQEQEQAQGGVMEDLESTMQREMAWRARALELERAVQAGGNLPSLLKALGLHELRQQTLVLQALLDTRETALPFIRAIRQVEARTIERLVSGQIQRTCAHPICNQVTKQKGLITLRVDKDVECEICQGEPTRRWFARMVQECERAGIRRLLVIGGVSVHGDLRRLSQGEPVDLRLVTDEEEALDARIQGRVEGCDLLVIWSPKIAQVDISERYARRAHAEERMVVRILGDRPDLVAFARAVTHRLARGHILLPT